MSYPKCLLHRRNKTAEKCGNNDGAIYNGMKMKVLYLDYINHRMQYLPVNSGKNVTKLDSFMKETKSHFNNRSDGIIYAGAYLHHLNSHRGNFCNLNSHR